jgi:hypothetical protein
MKKLLVLAVCLTSSLALAKPPAAKADKAKPAADALKTHTITVQPRSYVSLHEGKAYPEAEAAAHKADLDFVYVVAQDAGSTKRELYNLSGKDVQLPAELVGPSSAGIVALTWDDDLLAKCKTVSDLKRMTGSYTANSFSFYGTLANNKTGDLDQKKFIFLDAKGRMGVFTVKRGEGDALVLDVKIMP